MSSMVPLSPTLLAKIPGSLFAVPANWQIGLVNELASCTHSHCCCFQTGPKIHRLSQLTELQCVKTG